MVFCSLYCLDVVYYWWNSYYDFDIKEDLCLDVYFVCRILGRDDVSDMEDQVDKVEDDVEQGEDWDKIVQVVFLVVLGFDVVVIV